MIFTDRACAELEKQPPNFIYQRYCRFNWARGEANLRTGRPLFLEYNGSEVWMAKHWGRSSQLDLLERCERLNLTAATRIFGVAGVEPHNYVRGGVIPENIVVKPKWVDACEILLSPHVPLEDGSEFFGSRTKLFEYMAMGKGIVASRLGQIGEVLVDQETGLLTEPGNARELADAILRLSGSPELRNR